jgi:hypothetical protein
MSKQLTESLFEEAAMAWLAIRQPYISERSQSDYRKETRTLSLFFGEAKITDIAPDQIRAIRKCVCCELAEHASTIVFNPATDAEACWQMAGTPLWKSG